MECPATHHSVRLPARSGCGLPSGERSDTSGHRALHQAAGRVERTHHIYRSFRPDGDGSGRVGQRQTLRFLGTKAGHGDRLLGAPAADLSYTLAHNPHMVVFLQALDGIGAGIYGVVIIAFAADLTRGKGQFNSLLGIFATAQAIGGVVGPSSRVLSCNISASTITFVAFAVLALPCSRNLSTTGPPCRSGEK